MNIRFISAEERDSAWEKFVKEHPDWVEDITAMELESIKILAEMPAVQQGVKEIAACRELGSSLANLDTNRGSASGFKGFVNEPLVAHEAVLAGKNTKVLGNNGVADLETIGKNGHKYHKQLKVGYKTGKIPFEKYKGQEVAFDKGNKRLKTFMKQGKAAGVKVTETGVTEGEASNLAKAMRLETRITGQKNARIVPAVLEAKETVAAVHRAGVSTAKTGAQFGGSFSFGKNMVKVINGEKSMSEAVEETLVDTAVSGLMSYATGAATTALASTSAGATALGALGSAAASFAGTSAGGAVVGAVASVTAAVASAPILLLGTVLGGLYGLFSD